MLDKLVSSYICTDDSPDEWVLDRTFHVRDLRVGTSFALTHDNVVRVKLVYPNRSAYVFIHIVSGSEPSEKRYDAFATNSDDMVLMFVYSIFSSCIFGGGSVCL